jgi:hypothetical protein
VLASEIKPVGTQWATVDALKIKDVVTKDVKVGEKFDRMGHKCYSQRTRIVFILQVKSTFCVGETVCFRGFLKRSKQGRNVSSELEVLA